MSTRIRFRNRVATLGLGLLLVVCRSATAEQQCFNDTIAATAPTSRFSIDGEQVTDLTTGLMWRRCFEGASGPDCTQGEPASFSWPAAMLHTAEVNEGQAYGGYNDWRLPNIKELVTIAELQCTAPALNPDVFPAAPVGRVWSGSPYKLYPHYSWFVDTRDMSTSNLERFNRYPIVLVRDPD